MKIKKGEFYRYDDGPKVFGPNDVEFEHDDAIRVIVRDAKPRRTIKPSEALAWLMKQEGWRIVAGDDSGTKRRFYVTCDVTHAEGFGETLTGAIISMRRRFMGVK